MNRDSLPDGSIGGAAIDRSGHVTSNIGCVQYLNADDCAEKNNKQQSVFDTTQAKHFAADTCEIVRASIQSLRPMNDEITHKLFRLIEQQPNLTQRELSSELGISLGKTNYCVKALIKKGWLKAKNFKNSDNKIAYAYLLTPTGFTKKAEIANRFLQHKIHEYEALKKEIKTLEREITRG